MVLCYVQSFIVCAKIFKKSVGFISKMSMSVPVHPVSMVLVQIASMDMYAIVRWALQEVAVILVS